MEEFQTHLEKEEERRDDNEDKLQRGSKILVDVKAGVEHLGDKLYHLKAVSSWKFERFTGVMVWEKLQFYWYLFLCIGERILLFSHKDHCVLGL